jgi:hypothetical protein
MLRVQTDFFAFLKKKGEDKEESRRKKPMNSVATIFATQPVFNDAWAAHTLRPEQLISLINQSILCQKNSFNHMIKSVIIWCLIFMDF